MLVWELARPTVMRALARARESWPAQRARSETDVGYDPGRERRAEQRARELLRSCVSERDWDDVQRAGAIRVDGPLRSQAPHATAARPRAYAYLIYPHKPIVALVPRRGRC